MALTIAQSLKILDLKSPFSLLELKAAYRSAALKTHPDCGGTEERFILVDKAYDLLKSCASDKNTGASQWDEYWEARLEELRQKFISDWREYFEKAKAEKSGLYFSTCIERFTRAYLYPKREWFVGALFDGRDSQEDREDYRSLLLDLAPNKRLREEFALKYYRLEFDNAPYVFYLPPSLSVAN